VAVAVDWDFDGVFMAASITGRSSALRCLLI